MAFDLPHFLATHFPGLALEPGIFYRWPVALRFELGGRALTEEQISGVLIRATSLFETAFPEDDACVVIAPEWPDQPNDPLFDHLWPFARFNHALGVGVRPWDGSIELERSEDGETYPYRLCWTQQGSRTFDYRKLFLGIANADHARDPCLGVNPYFLNPRTGVILDMYDDRGLDMVAVSTDSLSHLYSRFNDWILDYDRAKIDSTFAPRRTN